MVKKRGAYLRDEPPGLDEEKAPFSWKEQKLVLSTDRTRNKDNCAGEDQQLATTQGTDDIMQYLLS
jgi:hypothetical protein